MVYLPGVLDLKLSMPKGMGGPGGPGTNPEQLFSAGEDPIKIIEIIKILLAFSCLEAIAYHRQAVRGSVSTSSDSMRFGS